MTKCKSCKTANGNKAKDNLCKSCYDDLQKDKGGGSLPGKLPEISAAPVDLPELPEGWEALPLSGFSAGQLANVMFQWLSPITAHLEDLRNKFQSIQLQKKVLEAKCDEYEQSISVLKSIVSKQQHSLSMIDADERECNVIVSGLSEDNITIGDQNFQNDKDKIAAVLGEIDAPLPAEYSVERIGKESSNYTRIIKLKVGSKINRDAILLKSKDLKDNSETSVNSVYLKKDLHPVLVHENNRLRRKMNDLKKLESNKGKEIKLLKGKLLIDNSVVDQNMLFA